MRRVLGAAHGVDVDHKAVYEAMCLLSTMFQAHLTIDYGNIQGNANEWKRIPGEEVSGPIQATCQVNPHAENIFFYLI